MVVNHASPGRRREAAAEFLPHAVQGDERPWVDADDLPALHRFLHGLRRDLDAVVAELTLPYSNGLMEGANTKVKLLKRQMYGRASFALPRQRILLA
jgi:transposase